jgi:hypothetical protein
MMAAIVVVVLRWPSTWLGALLAILGLLAVGMGALLHARAPTEPLTPVFDRRVPHDEAIDFAERRRYMVHLLEHWSELEAAIEKVGGEPFERFLELRLDIGIARHQPELARAQLAAAREQSMVVEDRVMARALELLDRDLDRAVRHGARFCLVPISGWSGLIEANLRLFLG